MVARKPKKHNRQPKVRVVVRGLVHDRERKLLDKLRRSTCSEPWVWAQVKFFPAIDEKGEPLEVLDYQPGKYPVVWKGPEGDNRGMVRCKGCEKFYPPIYVKSRGYCEDCISEKAPAYWINAMPSSCSAIDMGKAKAAIRRGIPTVDAQVGMHKNIKVDEVG